MLKKSASGVLASFRPSTYHRGYVSGLHLLRPCWTAFLSILREYSLIMPDVRYIEIRACHNSFFHRLLAFLWSSAASITKRFGKVEKELVLVKDELRSGLTPPDVLQRLERVE